MLKTVLCIFKNLDWLVAVVHYNILKKTNIKKIHVKQAHHFSSGKLGLFVWVWAGLYYDIKSFSCGTLQYAVVRE